MKEAKKAKTKKTNKKNRGVNQNKQADQKLQNLANNQMQGANSTKNKEPLFRYGSSMWYQQVDYIYVDEIQDISLEVLIHLCQLARKNIMLFGDNAQNIAKGISLRFNYLTTTLKDSGFNTTYIQLTKNFRSHQNILNLGNSIVKLLTVIARGDLEIMPDELSERSGPKPLMIKLGDKVDVLKSTLVQSLDASEIAEDSSLRFKNEFVVLVRDQESKKNLPEFLKNAVCMTIKESKGLEFEDVLIYDFFDTSKSYLAWRMLSNIDIVQRSLSSKEYFKIKDNYDQGIIDQDRVYLKAEKAKGGKFDVSFAVLDNISSKNKALSYDDVNDELKQFYVAVTRTKNRLLIYDSAKKHNS